MRWLPASARGKRRAKSSSPKCGSMLRVDARQKRSWMAIARNCARRTRQRSQSEQQNCISSTSQTSSHRRLTAPVVVAPATVVLATAVLATAVLAARTAMTASSAGTMHGTARCNHAVRFSRNKNGVIECVAMAELKI